MRHLGARGQVKWSEKISLCGWTYKGFPDIFRSKIRNLCFGCMHFTRDVYISLISIDLQTRRADQFCSVDLFTSFSIAFDRTLTQLR